MDNTRHFYSITAVAGTVWIEPSISIPKPGTHHRLDCLEGSILWIHQLDYLEFFACLFPMDSWAPLNMNRSRFTRRLITLLHYQNISIPTIPSSSKRNQQMMSRHGGANRILRYELLEFLDEAGLGFCWHERSELLHVGPSLSQRDHWRPRRPFPSPPEGNGRRPYNRNR